MAVAWDTMVAARLRASGPEVAHALARRINGDAIAVTAPTVLEIAYGLRKGAEAGNRRLATHLQWVREFLGDVVEVLPFDMRAAHLAGEARALAPTPPAGRRPERRSKAEHRAGWLIDLQIAATAYVHGHDIVTSNKGDFDAIARTFDQLAPGAPPLRVVTPPAFG